MHNTGFDTCASLRCLADLDSHCRSSRTQVKVLALEGHVLDLQRQLQQLELQRTHEMCALAFSRTHVKLQSGPPLRHADLREEHVPITTAWMAHKNAMSVAAGMCNSSRRPSFAALLACNDRPRSDAGGMFSPQACLSASLVPVQLERNPMQRKHVSRAQLETLRKYVHEPASAPAQPGANGSDPAGALVAPEERTRGWRPSTPTVVAVRAYLLIDDRLWSAFSVFLWGTEVDIPQALPRGVRMGNRDQ